ncbi:two-component sensor histidine kinase [[Clostridium] sordellii]|uniref:ATP-binding protein n=1 Tax=Paraclostridium sordellii TaxID=1505 RepID=UPI0005E120BA|nr:ATP-binding protein [Paeniclostridium sordellii]CEP50526.1 two-component sensor histidine kinase [[Clostridium] sordellii] [Paeniclostridium sordellii]
MERLILEIIWRINDIIYIAMFYFMVNKIYDRKKFTNKFDYIFIFILVILIYITPEIFYTYGISYIYQGLLLTILCKKIFKVSLKHAFVSGMCFSFEYGILIDTIGYLVGLMEVNYTPISNILYVYISLNIILILLIIYIDKIIKSNLNIKYYIYIVFTVITNIVCVLSLIKSNKHIEDIYYFIVKNNINTYIDKNNSISLNLMPFLEFTKHSVVIAIILCNIFLIVIINRIIKNMKNESEMKALNDKLGIQYNHYLSIQESQIKVRQLYHDINNHMACIRKIQNKDVNEYIDSINEELKDYKYTFNTENMILDIILNEKKYLCDVNNIKLFCDINFSKCDFIEMIDVSSIFSNILDNAIEACKKVEDNRYINIRGTIVKDYYIIKCENSKDKKIHIKNKKIITSKKDKFLHGLGLRNIKSSLNKYNGDLEIIDEESKFIINIYIPLD